MMLAPAILIDQAKARTGADRREEERRQREGRGDNRRPGRDVDLPFGQRGNLVGERDFGDWDRSYIGVRSFKLIDDPEFNRISSDATTKIKELLGATKRLDDKEKVVTATKKKVTDIEKEIGKLSQEIVEAIGTKTKTEAQLPSLTNQVTNATNQKNLAQNTFDSTKEDLDAVNAAIETAEGNLETVKAECQEAPADNCERRINRATNRLNNAKAKKPQAQTLFNTAKGNLQRATKNLEAREKKLADAKALIAKITSENAQRSTKIDSQKGKLASAKVAQQKAINELEPIKKAYIRTLMQRNDAVARKNVMKGRLIEEIMKLNRRGGIVGEEAGSIDGDYYAESIGVSEGMRDGDAEGTRTGTRDGQNSAYNRGLGQGEIEGRADAETRGLADGTKLGTDQANTQAGSDQGTIDGTQNARNSNAAEVGSNQGASAGLDRAVREGKSAGNALGERQAIQFHETKSLNDQNANGNFAGAFAAQVPSYPGFDCIQVGSRRYYRDDYGWRGNRRYTIDHRACPNFRPAKHSEYARTNRPILKEAFLDGYLRGYRLNRRGQFVEAIDRYYLNAYDNSRDAAYAEFSSRSYPEYRERGRGEGFQTAFNARYPVVKEEARVEAYAQTINNPNRDSSQYRDTYARVQRSTYNRVYEQIRSANFNRVEGETFANNIEEQTEIFRKARYAAVDAIYKNHPVMKFVSSSIHDGGINGVAKNDGVFQPGETTLHNVTLINYGDKPATNVIVTNEEGTKIKLPAIAGKSKVTIKGAAKGSVPSRTRIGTRHESTLTVFSPLSAEATIQGRHYYASSTGRMNRGDKKNQTIQYPLSLSHLKTEGQLLINETSTLKVVASNNSKRKYTGNLKIELSVDSQTGIITREFTDLKELSGSKTLDSARVLVASERDVYTPLTFSAKITKQGVTLGTLSSALTTMAKAPYSEKSGKPVFVADSSKNARDLMQAIRQVGGLSKASVIDLSLGRLNREVLTQGLNKKMMVVLDDLRGSTVKGVASLLKKAEDTVMLFVDERNQGINTASTSGVLKNAAVLPVVLKGNSELFNLRFTNPHLDGVDEMTVVAQTTPRGMTDAIKTLQGFMKTNNELVSEAGSALNKNNVNNTNEAVQKMIAMATAEIVTINQAYKATNNDRFEDVVRGANMIYVKVLDASGKKVKRSTLSKNLAAMVMYNVVDTALDKFDPVDDVMSQDIEREVEDRLRDTIKGDGFLRIRRGLRENLKRHDESLYNQIDDNKLVHSPFRIN